MAQRTSILLSPAQESYAASANPSLPRQRRRRADQERTMRHLPRNGRRHDGHEVA